MNPTQTAKFRFGPVRQETGAKHVRQGDLLEAINVRQTAKAGVYAKRKAFARTAQAFVGGSLIGTPETVLPGTSGDSLMRDTGDHLWARSASNNSWNLMGTHPRPWPEMTVLQGPYTAPQPFSCVVGSSLWMFSLTTNAYEFVIVDPTTGAVNTAKIAVAATGIVHASTAYDGTNVWVFWVDNGANGTVRCHKLTPATPASAPVATNYYTFPIGVYDLRTIALQQVQAKYLSSAGKVFVIASGGELVGGNYRRGLAHSALDPATGLAVVAGGQAAQVSYEYSGATGLNRMGALCILENQDGSGTNLYYSAVGDRTGFGYANIILVTVPLASFSTFTLAAQAIGLMNLAPGYSAVTCGYVDNANSSQYVFASVNTNNPGYNIFGFASGIQNTYRTWLFQANAGVITTDATYPDYFCDWMAGGFALYNGSWYALTAFDDVALCVQQMITDSNSLQRCYRVRKFTPGATATASKLSIVSQYLVGNAPAIFHRPNTEVSWPTTTPNATCMPPLHTVGNILVSAATNAAGPSGFVNAGIIRTSMAKVYGKSCQAMGKGFSPGSIPVAWDAQNPPHEIAPLLFPSFLSIAGGSGAAFTIAAAVLAIYDGDGTTWRSAPIVVSQTINAGATMTIPTPISAMVGTQLYLEIYLGTNGTPKLQTVVKLSSAAYYYTYTVPALVNMVNGEILYTTGNALSNTWPQPCQAIGTWGNRVFLAQKNVLWTSKEMEPGFGPLFNEVQVSTWNEERNEITAIAPVDWNYLGMGSEGQVAVISGPGPDGVGNGNYVIKTLPSYTGVAAGGVALQGAQGMYYQNKGTGRIMCLQPSLQVMEAAGGAYDYASYNFSVAAWYESENLMVFFAPASGAAIAIDYQHPQDVAPFGQVYLWTFAAGFVPAAACRDDSGLLVVSALGSMYRTTASQWVDDNASGGTDTYAVKLTTAELQMGDLQGGFNLKTLQVLLSMRGASSVQITTFPGYASATGYDGRTVSTWIALPAPTNSGDVETVMTKPENCMRIQSFRVSIQEMAGVTSQSFEFEGIGIEFSTNGRLLRPASGRVI